MKAIVIIFICACIEVNAQSVFCKIYSDLPYDYGYSAKQTNDGGYIICGQRNTNFGYLIKTDTYGDTIWTKKYGDSLYSIFNDVHLTLDGGYVVVGTKRKPPLIINTTNEDILFIKINANGDTLWQKEIGGPGVDRGQAVAPLADSTYIILGLPYLIKTDKNGIVLWQKTYGDSTIGVYAIDTTSNSGFIIAGLKQNILTLVKTNNVGDTLWTKTLGNTSFALPYSIKQTPDKGYIVCGRIQSVNGWDAYMVKTDPSGNIKWTKTIGTTGWAFLNSVQVTNDKNYIFAGSINNDVLMVKTDSLGTTLWQKTYGDSIFYNGSYIGESNDKGFFIAGYTLDSTSVNYGDIF